MVKLDRFRMATLHSFSKEMIKIWRDQIPHLAFRVRERVPFVDIRTLLCA
jgi:hypothetical protein